MAARGGLRGGEGIPELTSGIPLCPYCIVSISSAAPQLWQGREGHTAGAGRGVVETLQKRRARIDSVAAGQDGRASLHGRVAVGLVMTITVVFVAVGFRHCGKLPRLWIEMTLVVNVPVVCRRLPVYEVCVGFMLIECFEAEEMSGRNSEGQRLLAERNPWSGGTCAYVRRRTRAN